MNTNLYELASHVIQQEIMMQKRDAEPKTGSSEDDIGPREYSSIFYPIIKNKWFIFGPYVCLLPILIVLIFGKKTYDFGEMVSGAILIVGSIIIASGSILNKNMQKFLLNVERQERNSVTKTRVYEDAYVLDLLVTAMRKKVAGASDSDILEHFLSERTITAERARLRVHLSQKNLANVFIDVSVATYFGTAVVVCGTILLMVISIGKHINA